MVMIIIKTKRETIWVIKTLIKTTIKIIIIALATNTSHQNHDTHERELTTRNNPPKSLSVRERLLHLQRRREEGQACETVTMDRKPKSVLSMKPKGV